MIIFYSKKLVVLILLTVLSHQYTYAKKNFLNRTFKEATVIGIALPCLAYCAIYYYYIHITSFHTYIQQLYDQKIKAVNYLEHFRSVPEISGEQIITIKEIQTTIRYYLRLLKIKLFFSSMDTTLKKIINEYEDLIKQLSQL